MKIIFAQGNPEERYQATRHNVGFQIVDALAKIHGCAFISKPKFFANIAEYTIAGEKVLLVKPTTYYNETGRSLHAILDFYKLTPSETVIIHDDLALPFGTIRLRVGGSDAGNNGIKSINQHGGTATNRIRVGIAAKAHSAVTDIDFVLGKFTKDEQTLLTKQIIPATMGCIASFINDEFTAHSISVLNELTTD